MIENFFDHKCDIYHITEKTATQGYGLPSSIGFDYPETPDITALPCHFGVKNASVYTAEQPRNIRDHHIFVYIKRVEKDKAL